MLKEEWDKSTNISRLLGKANLSKRKKLLLGCACCRRVKKHLTLELMVVIDGMELYADGKITFEEMKPIIQIAVSNYKNIADESDIDKYNAIHAVYWLTRFIDHTLFYVLEHSRGWENETERKWQCNLLRHMEKPYGAM